MRWLTEVNNRVLSVAWLVLTLAAFSVFAHEPSQISQVIEDSRHAVVSITIESNEIENKLIPDDLRAALEGTPLMEMLRQMFGDKLEEKLSGKAELLASGTIISEDGYIVTNYHVVQNAKLISVHSPSHGEFFATLVGKDPATDIALLKVPAKNLPFLTFSDSNKVKVGQWVLAIGSPYGFENTVTTGIVSARGRSLPGERYVPFIQTDVAINPGNSGGPLLTLKGEMIGINSQILSNSGSFVGISFAMPSNLVKKVVAQLKSGEEVSRGWIGIAFQGVDRYLAESFGLSSIKGALITRVIPKSPADKAGLKPGDVIIEFKGRKINRATDLPPIVGILPVDSKVKVKFIRQQKEMEKTLVLDANRVQFAPSDKRKKPSVAVEKKHPLLVRNLEAGELSVLPQGGNGVVVMEIRRPQWKTAGIRRGDTIMAVNQIPIVSREQFYQILADLSEKEVLAVLVGRQDQIERYLTVRK